MRDKYELQLKQLNDLMIHMGSLIEAAIEMAIEALVKGDADKAREAVEFDDTIDQTQKDIESLCNTDDAYEFVAFFGIFGKIYRGADSEWN